MHGTQYSLSGIFRMTAVSLSLENDALLAMKTPDSLRLLEYLAKLDLVESFYVEDWFDGGDYRSNRQTVGALTTPREEDTASENAPELLEDTTTDMPQILPKLQLDIPGNVAP